MINTMGEQHLDQAFALTQQLQWPHRRADWQQALALGQGLVAIDDGQLLGTTLFWRWGDYATLGLVIVADRAQGRGIGKQLMLTAMAQLKGCHLRLHATEMGRGLYQKLGFMATGQIVQHQCRQLAATPVLAAGQSLRPARREEQRQLSELDRQAHGLQRPALIACLFDGAERFIVLEKQGRAVGFACLRRFGQGFAIGPIICGEVTQAQALVSELLSGLEGEFVRIDTDRSCGLGDWLSTLGMTEVDAPVIMYKGKPWQPEGVQAFGLMSQAMA